MAAWNNEEKREEVFTYIFTHLSRFDDFKRVQNNIQMLAPGKKFTGEPVKIEREMNDEEERAAREAERRRISYCVGSCMWCFIMQRKWRRIVLF